MQGFDTNITSEANNQMFDNKIISRSFTGTNIENIPLIDGFCN
jgi:hypothetical protein